MLADALGRALVLKWRPQRDCNCPFQRLFEPRILGADEALRASGDEALAAGIELLDLWDDVVRAAKQFGPDSAMELMARRSFEAFHEETYRSGLAYLVDPAGPRWRDQRPLEGEHYDELPDFLKVDCICVRAFNPFYPPRDEDRVVMAAERSRILREIAVPTATILKLLPELPKDTISVHVRRTDHEKAIGRSPDHLFFAQMDAVVRSSSTMLFLATDDPHLEEEMQRRYGERLLSYRKRSRDRNSPEGVEDALVDLLLLSKGKEIIGSYRSSFSSVAALFNSVPLKIMDVYERGGMDPIRRIPFREVQVFTMDPAAAFY